MKINYKDLQKQYKAYIRENSILSRKNCPSIKKFINFFKSKMSEKQKTKIIDHVTNCYFCAQEFEFIFQILRYVLKLNEEIASVLRSKNDRKTIKKVAKSNISNQRKKQKIFFPMLSWKYTSLIIGTAIIISALIILYNSGKKEYRGINHNQLYLIEPVDGKYSKSLLLFKWNKFKGSDYYILELFDETLFPIWKSNKIFKNHIILPNEIAKSLNENKTYFWIATAFLPNGRKIESEIGEFTLSD